MSKNEVYFDNQAIDGMMAGAEKVYRAVSSTMGAAGRNVGYRKYGKPAVTNDGYTIAKLINPKDDLESQGAGLLTQAAERTNEEVGDATSATITLGYKMAEKGIEYVKAGYNPMRLKREMQDALTIITSEIKDATRPADDEQTLFNIANISVENPKIARIVSDAVKRAGPDGNVIVDESTGIEISKEEIDGLRFDKGYISPWMVTSPERMECVMEDVFVLLTDKNLNMNNDLLDLIDALAGRGIKKLVVIAEDVSGELLASLISNRQKGIFHTVCVKKPYYKETLEDLAAITGGQTLTSEKGIREIRPEHAMMLGKAKRVVVTAKTCMILGQDTQETRERVKERVDSIKNELKDAETYETAVLKDRLAKLVGGVVIIKVGAATEGEMRYWKDKIDDAVAATKAAMEEGYVLGGGRLLHDVSRRMSFTRGEEVVRSACSWPMRRIIENAGEDSDKVINGTGWFTRNNKLPDGAVFNAMTGMVSVKPFEEGLIDPAKAERCALKNGMSFAINMITTGTALADLPEEGPGMV